VLRAEPSLRVLGPADVEAVTALLARNPVVNVFADYRVRSTGLDPRALGAEVWGFYDRGRLVSVCHAGANLVPAEATEEALASFADHAAERGRRCASVVGPAAAVAALWDRLRDRWDPPRETRWTQPHLEIRTSPGVAPDPGVRALRADEVDIVYPACVRFYTEELGVSPEAGGGRHLYRARIAQLVARGWAFARVEDGEVVFKAEVAAATPHACQVQGVYVAPERRGRGLGAAGMAAVVELARRQVAPVVSLYVNDHNVAARRAYQRVGFRQTEVFSTVMF
jgi:predicted GNAT family acetyltransferase